MDDLRRAFLGLDSITAPDLWPEIERRAAVSESAPRPATGRFQSMLGATRLVVAGAVVAVFAGVLLVGLLTRPTEVAAPAVGVTTSPESSAVPPVEVPAVIPQGIDSGTLATPLGPARWMHLSGDAETLPSLLDPVPVPGGYLSLDHDPAQLWFSPDLVEWTRRPLPVETTDAYPQLSVAGGAYWFAANDGAPSLWRSTDALEWEKVDLSSMEAPRSGEGIEWLAWLPSEPVAVSGEAILVHLAYDVVHRNILGLPEAMLPDGSELERVDVGRYAVLGGPNENELGRVRLEDIDGGLRVIDEATDAELNAVEGVSVDRYEQWVDGGSEVGLALLQDGRLEPVELLEADPVRFFTVIGNDDGFIAHASDADGLIQTWTSPDGSSWTLGELLGDDPGEPTPNRWFGHGPDGLTAVFAGPDAGAGVAWDSTDGLEWQPRHGVSAFAWPARIGSSWVVLDEIEGTDEVELTIVPDDGGSTAVDVTDLRMKGGPVGGGESWMRRIGPATIVQSVSEERDAYGWQRDHWIITFDDPPA